MIPAIITSTAIVGGLMCLELYKILQYKPLTDYRHAYFNLAVPFFTFAQPIKAVEHTVRMLSPNLSTLLMTWIGILWKWNLEISVVYRLSKFLRSHVVIDCSGHGHIGCQAARSSIVMDFMG